MNHGRRPENNIRPAAQAYDGWVLQGVVVDSVNVSVLL